VSIEIPWYCTFFGPSYWDFASREHTAEGNDREIDYVQSILGPPSHDKRVLDLGCGPGRHAIGLARRGYDVTGIDVSSWAIAEAKRRSALEQLEVNWREADLLRQPRWPVDPAGAAICMQSFGYGNDSENLRFLKRVRRHLSPDGVLLLDLANPFFVLRHDLSEETLELSGMKLIWQRAYDAVAGRCRGSLIVKAPSGEERRYLYQVRMYTVPEIVKLVGAAGFRVCHVDADFMRNRSVTEDTRSEQVVATARPHPPASLSVSSYAQADSRGIQLDLKWSPEEGELLDIAPAETWRASAEDFLAANGWEKARHYAVDDPYAANRSAPALSSFFSFGIAPANVYAGAGVSSLLFSLARLATDSVLMASPFTYPDLSSIASAAGAHIEIGGESVSRLITKIEDLRPDIVQLDRPGLAGNVASLDEVLEIGRAAARAGIILLVDESSANYLGPAASCISCIEKLDNLIVLRGMSKGYGAGGLRIGFVIASLALRDTLREVLPHLQASELALMAALRLLHVGDIFQRLRARVEDLKPEFSERLARIGMRAISGHAALPWVLISDPTRSALDHLARLGIRGKRPVFYSGSPQDEMAYVRLAVPLSEQRLELARRLLSQPPKL
jgi:histidinol-phosphate/aromatic aminotransferase/cobyric acid decarboxylase-like protein/SAM-dependent methyltransferase